ncbi:hypothetical protein DDZ18_02165 [Marinicauda salina]|uniref:Uncharacterized protein n=1 Tax=Marinicauda salina TaxID=2135793 RepID=A0A2U2BWN7_9PROT|nr:hypothetical protein [Marinicauda salina]PWE18433.1 hypothetical protein DDZ18_02165 [Marinicauda salina]
MTERSSPPRWRLRFETVGSITAIVVGVAALFVSWDQGRVMRQEIRASVWPALQVDGFVESGPDELSMGLRVQNAGVGPALIERFTVYEQGELVRDIADLRARMGEDVDFSQESLTGRIIAAGDEVRPFLFRYDDPAAAAAELGSSDAVDILAAVSGRWEAEVCYCSSLGQCWTSDLSPEPPVETARCDAAPASDL